MESAVRVRRAAVAVLACAAGAALLYFGSGLHPYWPLLWLAPLPLLLFALGRSAWQGAGVAAAAWGVGSLNLWTYERVLSWPVAVSVLFDLVSALVFAAGVLLTRGLLRRGAPWSAWVALPALWVSFEYGRNLLWAHGSAASIAYTQLNFLPFLQWAAVAGPWGMGFVLLLFPTGLALAIHAWSRDRRQALQVACATVGVTAAVLLFGVVRLAIPQPGPLLTVGLAASDDSLLPAQPGAATQHLLTAYAQTAQQLTARGAQAVVLPENLGVVVGRDVEQPDALFQGLADRSGAVVVAGMTRALSLTKGYNEARIYTPHASVRSYDKQHLLPPVESQYTAGTSRTLLTGPAGPTEGGRAAGPAWGVAICKDFDFTEPARAYGRSGVGMMLAPAWDFRVDEFFHGHIAVMRAVEDGFSLVRAAKGGFLTVADNRGRILAEARSNTAAFATLIAVVPTGHDPTLFLALGDGFGGFALALLALVLVRLLGRRRSVPGAASTPDSTHTVPLRSSTRPDPGTGRPSTTL